MGIFIVRHYLKRWKGSLGRLCQSWHP